MSTKETVVSKAVSTGPIPAISFTSHTEGAQARRRDLQQMWDLIPRKAIPLSPTDRIRLNSAASVPAQFVELTTVAVANEKSLVRGEGAPPDVIRDLMAYADAYDPFADELEAFALFVRHSVTAARHFAGTEALTTYSLAQRLAKQPATAHLAPRVADMRRALGRMRKLTAEQREQREAEKAAKAAGQPS
ncbi:MAG TPA: hypothetical protein VEK57_22955 [Thermoanaerobaculia bacterium]|nr:hypothetical protein [Thermoanaerobaculia bacterium]